MGASMTDKEIRAEIDRLQAAVNKTKSPYLKRDYEKRIKKLRFELMYKQFR